MGKENTNMNFEIGHDMKSANIMEGRNKFIMNNNMCIIETISIQDNILMNNIIKPLIFNDNYMQIAGLQGLFIDRLSFVDKYKMACKIADYYNVDRFKKIEKYVKMRNGIAHNLTSVINLNDKTKESEIIFADQIMTWTNYKEELNEWAKLSLEMAKFLLKIYEEITVGETFASFPYCKVEGDCVLVQHVLLYPEPDGDYVSFFRSGFNMDLLDYLNEEVNYIKQKSEE